MRGKKSLGQHFLVCQWAVDTLIRAVQLTPDDTVLEIGPGTGILTRALAPRVKKVIAVEKDEQLAAALETTLQKEGIENLEIVSGDILSFFQTKSGYSRLSLEPSYKIVANIPYYLTSHLLRVVLENGPRPELMALTIQKEVAERIVAKPPHMNLLALSVAAFGTAKIIKTVPAECFLPKPKVDSAIIAISDISDDFFHPIKSKSPEATAIAPTAQWTSNGANQELFFRVIRSTFNQKRKQLANALASVAGDKKTAREILRAAHIDPRSRPEELTLKQWADIVQRISFK